MPFICFLDNGSCIIIIVIDPVLNAVFKNRAKNIRHSAIRTRARSFVENAKRAKHI